MKVKVNMCICLRLIAFIKQYWELSCYEALIIFFKTILDFGAAIR